MWYEILPSMALVWGFITIPAFTSAGLSYLFNNGKRCARYWENDLQDFHLYLRDRRITGSEYVPKGLEAIPDEK